MLDTAAAYDKLAEQADTLAETTSRLMERK